MRKAFRPIVGLLGAAVLAAPASTQETRLGWADTAELTFVATDGNAEAQTLGFRNRLTHTAPRARFSLEAAGLRAETTTTTFRAEGTAPDFRIVEDRQAEVTSESYLLRGRYEYDFTERWYGFGGAGWERNQFAGFDNRYSVVAGGGRTWFATDETKLRTDLGATYTREESTLRIRRGTREVRLVDESLGARFSLDFLRRLTPSTTYTNVTYLDQNLDDTDDLRADMTQALAVSINETLALKVSLQLLYDNQPGLIGIVVPGEPGSGGSGRIVIERDELDSVLSVALVVNF